MIRRLSESLCVTHRILLNRTPDSIKKNAAGLCPQSRSLTQDVEGMTPSGSTSSTDFDFAGKALRLRFS